MAPRLCDDARCASFPLLVRLGWRTCTGAAARKGLPRKIKIMIYAMIYAIAALSLSFVAYLALDFYYEQVRTRLVPVRSNRRSSARSERRNQAW